MRRIVTLAALLAAVTLAHADLPIPVLRTRPLILHLRGTMASERAEAARLGFATVSFAVAGRELDRRHWLGVEEVHPLGDYPRLGKDILDDVRMYDPTFLIVGPPDLVKRSNATHASITDSDALLCKKAKGHEAKLSYFGHVLIEHRHGLVVNSRLTQATGRAEWEAAWTMAKEIPGAVGSRSARTSTTTTGTSSRVSARSTSLRTWPRRRSPRSTPAPRATPGTG